MPGQGLDSCVVVWFSFLVAVLVAAAGCWLLVVSGFFLAGCFWLLVLFALLVVGCWLLVACCCFLLLVVAY